MTTVRIIPNGIDELVALSGQCLAGATLHGASLNIKQNDATALAACRIDLVGDPEADPPTVGKLGLLDQKRQAIVPARIARRDAFQAARDFNAKAVDHLKGFLGRTWNPLWAGAALGICAWVVERRIDLKARVLPACHYHMASFHTNSQPKTLIEAVRARRIALGMSLREFSKAIGRNMWSISEWENERAIPRKSSRKRLVEWLGYDPEAEISIVAIP